MALRSPTVRHTASASCLGATEHRVTLSWTALAVLCWVGCANPQAEDRPALNHALEADHQVLAVIQEADRLAQTGHRLAAAEVLEGRGASAASRAEEEAKGLSPRSDWGKARKGELLSLSQDRIRDVKAYVAALRNDDAASMLQALRQEMETDKRAEAIEQALNVPR